MPPHEKFPISYDKIYDFLRQIFRFSRQKIPMTFFSRQLKKLSFLTKISIFTIYTYILRQFLSIFLQTNHFPTYILCKISYSNFPTPVHDPLRPPRFRDIPNLPGLTPML